MAKTTTDKEVAEVLEEKTTAEQLKKELQSVVQSIVEQIDFALDAPDRAMQALSRLKGLKLKLLDPQSLLRTLPPPEFKCPISGQLMIDPVVITSGETFDRPSIQKWLKDGNQTCPQTEQPLSNMILTPNLMIKEMISRWCKEHEIELPNPQLDVDEETVIANSDQGSFSSLLTKLSSAALYHKKMAAKEIRQRTKQSPSFRAHFGEIPDVISYLIEPLSSRMADMDPELQEDLVTAIFNLSLVDINKMLFAANPALIPLIIQAVEVGNIKTRSNAAATLRSLSSLESNKYRIVELGALKPLIKLLEEIHPPAMLDAANAIFSLCTIKENRTRAVSDGAVGVIMKKFRDSVLMDEMLCMLALLANNQKAIEEMAELGAMSFLLPIIRQNTNEDNKENAIAILYAMCSNDPEKLIEIKKEEDVHGTISQLACSGTSRAKRKANGLLERLH